MKPGGFSIHQPASTRCFFGETPNHPQVSGGVEHQKKKYETATVTPWKFQMKKPENNI